IVKQVVAYEKTIADLRRTVEEQKAEYEATIAKQSAQIVTLTSRVDTVTREKAALSDTVGMLTSEKNTANYIIGTKDQLIRAGILVEEGRKRFVILGGRPVAAARELDPSKFTKIDRLKDRVINFPAGDYQIMSRQNGAYAAPFAVKDGKMVGGLRIEQPERFW